ncbi:MAG: hypothetical protein BM564_08885 [Bacteroidetes bacterium MedPE-SWsnd-G2]|nr:MAG: hypothetical protein BM564_08885 [Bacteroidetes bacterium MedPE-SWsnd-G2]
MVKLFKVIWIGLILVFVAQNANAQGVFASTTVSKSNCYLGEPVVITVSVYTSTFFTSGVKIGNIKVEGGFVVFFNSISLSKVINGQTYAGVVKKFNVFPYEPGTLVIPAMGITVETPKPGDYKGVSQTVSTKERTVKVLPVPMGYDQDEWLVASNLRVTENWSNNTGEIKVGEVLERSITRRASGTVSEMIPPFIWDSLTGVSNYPKRSTVENIKSKTSISSKRSESVRYLFEKEGVYEFPERELMWFNPYQKKLFKRTLKAYKVKVLPNPDLGMLESVRDSLKLEKQKIEEPSEGEKEPLTILGLSPRDFIIAALVLLVVGRIVLKYAKLFYAKYKIKKENYLNSELYFFNSFVKESNSKPEQKLSKLYLWIDHLHLTYPTVECLNRTIKYKGLEDEANNISAYVDHGEKLNLNAKHWIKARNLILKLEQPKETSSTWVNPTFSKSKS